MYNKNINLEVLLMPRYKLSPEERAAEKTPLLWGINNFNNQTIPYKSSLQILFYIILFSVRLCNKKAAAWLLLIIIIYKNARFPNSNCHHRLVLYAN